MIKEIYSGSGNDVTVNYLNSEVFVGIEQKFYKISNGGLKLWKDLTGSSYTGKIWGGNGAYDFFAGADFGIGHYNGSDYKKLYDSPGFYYSSGIFIDNTLFVSGINVTNGDVIIVRAKKNN